ncbi:unnamed protein product [Nezara viridula]|uniref:Chitin-binding type-2 domain-containing protein n=1 Tax=Nezara viridula TaxID=85310 RepID=A0A9P0E5G4_NEZVI|nr:unnamed protein product [Nezara viridula]
MVKPEFAFIGAWQRHEQLIPVLTCPNDPASSVSTNPVLANSRHPSRYMERFFTKSLSETINALKDAAKVTRDPDQRKATYADQRDHTVRGRGDGRYQLRRECRGRRGSEAGPEEALRAGAQGARSRQGGGVHGISGTEFSCRNVKSSGYYADLETGCQVFHICDGGRKISFLCPNGTIFRQSHLICDWWFRVDCERSVELYEESAEQLAHDQMIYKKRAEEIAKAITVRTTSEAPRVTSSTQQRQYRRKPQQRTQPQLQQRTHSQPQQRTQSRLQSQYQPQQSQYQPQSVVQEPKYQTQPVTQQPQYQSPRVTQQPRYQQPQTQQPQYQQPQTQQPQYQQPLTQQPQYQQPETQQPQYQQPQTQQPQYQQPQTQQPQYHQPQTQQPQYQQPQTQQAQYQQPQTQQPQYHQPQTHQSQYQSESQPQQEEQERQIPAETASFASNRHRFANQLEAQYKQYAATTTTASPLPTEKNIYNYNGQRYQKTSSTTASYNPPSFQEISNNEEHSKEEYSKEEFSNEELINNNYPGSVYSSYNYTYQNADYYNSKHNYTNNYNFSSSDYVDTYSQQNGQDYQPETNRGTSKYFDNSQANQKDSLEPKSSYVSEIPYSSTTARSISKSEINSYNDHKQIQDNFQPVQSSTRNPLKQKTVFDVKIRPTKDFAYVELLRHEEYLKNQSKTTSAPVSYTSSSLSQTVSHETTPSSLNDDVIPVSRFATSTPPSQPSTRHTYLPTKATESSKQYTTTPTPKINRYASIHVSGTSEEIRPEVVNSLMESGVTPTSAKALHSLASYISSAAADDLSSIYGQLDGHPQVSDVILNFHSGTPATNSYLQNEVTTRSSSSPSEESLPSGLTKATKESYSYLFSESKEQTEKKGEVPNVPFLEIDYTTQKPQTITPQMTKGGDRDLRLKDSSELRELAQVFSRALSAYLEDPETFKEILAQVRPTEPSNTDHTTPSPDDEVLDFSDANQGQKGITSSPLTTLSNIVGYTDENLNIGDINNLAQGTRTFEPDNSLEHNTFPPTAPENYQATHFSSVTPSSVQLKVNSITNNTDPLDYYSRLGSKEDQSYFPTVGGVSDTSRPRYGGFQNNTQKTARAYSPYGSDVPKNLTGSPISITTPVVQTEVPLLFSLTNASSEKEGLPEPKDVNSLIKINVLNSDQSSSEENTNYQTSPSAYQDDTYFPSADQEKVLITAGSQSLVSSNNYLQFAKVFNEQSQKERSKYYPTLYNSNSYINYAPSAVSQDKFNTKEDYKSEEFIPFFGQEPPFENLAKPSGFQTTKESDNIKQDQTLTEQSDTYEKRTGIFADPINYHLEAINAELSTPSYGDKNSEYKVSYKNVDLGNGVTLEKLDSSTETRKYETTWTVSPLIDLTTASGSTLHHNYTSSPVPSSSAHYSSPHQYEATTYRPPRSSDSSDTAEFQWATTVQTESNSEETVTTSGLTDSTETVIPNENLGSFEKTAMDMFGNLNESAAVTLMDMMSKAEKNMTIRRLVLLLVNEKGKENRTIQESRENLINALLNNMEDIKKETTTSELPPLSASPSTPNSVYIPRKKVRVSRVRLSTTSEPPQNSGKFHRGTDTMTAVHGSPSDINKINSAKLYIPSPTISAYTNTLPIDSDARAVELLRTLYSLAAKWG